VLLRLPTLDQPLVEAYGFRLTFTAWTARLFHEQGIDLLHPQVPALGTPWVVPMEFPLYQALAALLMDVGVPEVPALRGLSLAFFTLTGWLLFRLVTRLLDEGAALAALLVFLFSPLAFLWSRASLMEFLVTAATLAWALSAWTTADAAGRGTRIAWGAMAVVAGSTAMLVKPTTAAWWCLPVLVGMGFTPRVAHQWWATRRRPRVPWAAATLIVLVPLALAAAWTRWADSQKQASPATQFLTSRNAAAWNFGSWEQRLSPDAWAQALGHSVLPVTGAAGLVALLVLVVVRREVPTLMWAVLATVPLTVLTFWNLYVVHGYYWAAVAPAIAAGIGTGAMLGLRRLPQPWQRPATVAAGAGWLVSTLLAGSVYVTLPYAQFPPDHEAKGVGARLAALSQPNDQAFVTGLEYDPSILYFADRFGLMLDPKVPPGTAQRQPDLEKYRYAVVLKPMEQPLESTLVRGWAAPRDAVIYELSDTEGGLGNAPLRFSANAQPDGWASSRQVSCAALDEQLRSSDVPLVVQMRGEATARLTFADTLAPIPGDARTIAIDPVALPDGWSLRCTGNVDIELEGDGR
jgi:hypothetical protein